MKIGFLGAGNVTRTFGRHLINAGHTIVVSNSRGPETLADFVADVGPGAVAGTKEQAAECDVVILAVHWVKVRDALKGIDWHGRILIDATNAHVDPKPDISLAGVTRSRAALKSTGRTSSEMVAEMAVGARLVKSISNMPMAWIQDFSPNKPRSVLFTSGDDADAKQLVIELINSTGLVAIDLGSLATGGAMHEVGAPLSGLELHFVRRLR
jgi:8-hydroxy-5-deazaflavin:NADPH oxidoreductase